MATAPLLITALPKVIEFIGGLFGGGSDKKRIRELEEQIRNGNAKAKEEYDKIAHQAAKDKEELRNKINSFESKNQELNDLVKKLEQEAKDNNLETLEDIEKYDGKRFDRVVELAKALPPAPIPTKHNVGIVGISGAGKSSLINAISGDEHLCEVGVAETTMEIRPHMVQNSTWTFWDIPGKTDEINYFSVPFLSIIKKMDFLGVAITRTTHEISRILVMLEKLNIPYYIIVNKWDIPNDAEKKVLKAAIEEREVAKERDHKLCKDIFYVSTKAPKSPAFLQLNNTIVTVVGSPAPSSSSSSSSK